MGEALIAPPTAPAARRPRRRPPGGRAADAHSCAEPVIVARLDQRKPSWHSTRVSFAIPIVLASRSGPFHEAGYTLRSDQLISGGPFGVAEGDLARAAGRTAEAVRTDQAAERIQALSQQPVGTAGGVHPAVHPAAEPALDDGGVRRHHRPLEGDIGVLHLPGQDVLVVVVPALEDLLGVEVDLEPAALAPAAQVDAVDGDQEAILQAEDRRQAEGRERSIRLRPPAAPRRSSCRRPGSPRARTRASQPRSGWRRRPCC